MLSTMARCLIKADCYSPMIEFKTEVNLLLENNLVENITTSNKLSYILGL